MGNQLSQMFPPAPTFTETSLPDLQGKVYIVTGASAGVGKELARLLYSHNGTVYCAARSSERANAAMAWMKEAHPSSTGSLHYLHLDLNDLDGIKPSAEAFLAKEERLDVLFNNAGVMVPPQGSSTKQGFEMQLGTNCVAPFLFTKLLTPVLVKTAKMQGVQDGGGGVRVVWVSSSAAHVGSPTGGLDVQNLGYEKDASMFTKYAVSKAGNVLHALEYQRRFGGEGVVSVSLNPGNLQSELGRHMPAWQRFFLKYITYPPVYGAYTELFAGLAPEAAKLKQSEWVVPWGRVVPLRSDLCNEVGMRNASAFWEWCEGQVERFA
ncbi:retinol dehydrogenase 12 [Stemphylium lycopersici]|uniref:Retinol dehydrogenase 12 n=1 Tax=Stemphylium lycopersici TaxID=183478 RepID=A0A364N4K6_STELY|nr:retinol dehydrogenase 12 [Stemphylium lycopersici]